MPNNAARLALVLALVLLGAMLPTALAAVSEEDAMSVGDGDLAALDLSEPRVLAAAKRNCKTVAVPPCQYRKGRDIIFALDTSNSMNRKLFYSVQLDFVESILCAFNPSDETRAGVITFSNKVVVRVPLAKYTMPQWFTKIEAIRKDSASCCGQGTPTAEAMDKARVMFASSPSLNERSTIFLTDGAPFQVLDNKAFPGAYTFPTVGMAEYLLSVVPTAAQNLKAISRLVVVGLPSNSGQLPRKEYFEGIPDPAAHDLCGVNPDPYVQGFRYNDNYGVECGVMNPALFPIPSEPLSLNWQSISFSSQLAQLLAKMVPILCTTPTLAPTLVDATAAPSLAGATLAPTPLTTGAPSLRPTDAPSAKPTAEPTAAPSAKPTDAPSAKPTAEPTATPSAKPTKEPTAKPSLKPTTQPTTKPTRFPTTRAPTIDIDLIDIDLDDGIDVDILG